MKLHDFLQKIISKPALFEKQTDGPRDLNSCLIDENIYFNRFHGATADAISHYTEYILPQNDPTDLTIGCGTNDILQMCRNDATQDPQKVVDSILTIARKGKARGVKNINIESIPIIRGRRHELLRNIINLRIKEACVPEGYFFIDNTNITLWYLNEDGIHLNPSGNFKIKLNLLKTCESFNPFLCDFYNFCDNEY